MIILTYLRWIRSLFIPFVWYGILCQGIKLARKSSLCKGCRRSTVTYSMIMMVFNAQSRIFKGLGVHGEQLTALRREDRWERGATGSVCSRWVVGEFQMTGR